MKDTALHILLLIIIASIFLGGLIKITYDQVENQRWDRYCSRPDAEPQYCPPKR